MQRLPTFFKVSALKNIHLSKEARIYPRQKMELRLPNIGYYVKIHAMNSKNEILDFLQKNKSYIFNTYHVTKIGVFGSFARDEQTSKSDVDLLIELEDGTTNIHDIKESLGNFLSNAFERSVDIAREKYLKSYAKESVLKDAIYV
jgi:predicted nucleotidyltransferase